MALTQDDKKFIEDAITRAFIDFWDQVLEKRFDSIEQKFESIEQKMVTKDELKEELKKLESRITSHVGQKIINARDSIDMSIEKYSSESIKRDRTLNEKTDTAADKLGAKDIFTESDVADIKNISPFPVQPTVE